jgi:AraC-like DNA-binding protein
MMPPPGRLRIWRPPDLDSLELRVGTSFEHPYPRHWHEELFLSAITGGAGNFFFRGTNHLATPGSLVVVAPGEVHAHSDQEGGRSFRSLHAPASFLGSAHFHSMVTRDRGVVGAFLKLHRAFERNESRLLSDSLVLELVDRLSRRTRDRVSGHQAAREYRAVRRAREFLDANYDRSISLKDLASVAHLSPFYFHRIFCRETGMPPHAYQIQVRLLRAKKLLRSGRPPAEVASATGFADQSHFNRHFKRLMGVTPARYAGRSKNVQDARTSAR